MAYVPAKIRDIAECLLSNQDVEACLGQIRRQYEKVTTRRYVLGKVRSILIDAGLRHEKYESSMAAQERELLRQSIQEPTARNRQRLETFYDFRACTMDRQIKLRKKMSLGETGLCDPQDLQFYINVPLYPLWIDNLRLTAEETQVLAMQSQKNLLAQSANVVRIEKCDELILRCRRILRNDTSLPEDLAVALALCTGRRMVELFLLGSFEIDAKEKNQYSLVFSGQAKTGLRRIAAMGVDVIQKYRIPVLASPTSIIRGIKRLRQGLENIETPRQVNSLWCRRLNAHVKTTIHPGLGFHDLRTLYALITFESFKPHRYGCNGWVAKVLGHSGVSISVHYTRMQVSGIRKIARHRNTVAEDEEIGDV